MIAVMCPTCRIAFDRDDNEAGTKIACPSCNQRLLIPQPPPPPPPPPQPNPKTVLALLQPAASNVTVLAALRPSHHVSAPPQTTASQVNPADKQAILAILQEDARLSVSKMGTVGGNLSPAEVAVTINDYASQAEKFDLSACPATFVVAYRQHMRAWREAQHAFEQIPDDFLKGLLALWDVLVGKPSGKLAQLEATLKKAQEKVRSTWEEVEKIGASYGAAL